MHSIHILYRRTWETLNAVAQRAMVPTLCFLETLWRMM